jgi:hypothetical protein
MENVNFNLRTTINQHSTISSPHSLPFQPSEGTTTKIAVDSGASSHYFKKSNAPCNNITPALNPISVRLPNKSTMQNTHEGYMNVPHLPPEACKAYLFDDMQSSLISVGQICQAGCTVKFDAHHVTIRKDDMIILKGQRDPTSGLYHVNLLSKQAPTAHPSDTGHSYYGYALSAIAAETIGERIAFLHACAGSPALSSFKSAIQAGYYTTWPELTAARVQKYLLASAATIKGHLDQQRKNLRSTKPKAKPKSTKPFQFPGNNETPADMIPESSEQRCNHVYVTCMQITGQIYSDQPGQFLVTSTSGMSYIMVVHCYDSNAILAVPMPSRSGKSLRDAYKEIHAQLTKSGFRPQYQRLDNEISAEFKSFLEEVGVQYQLTPAGSHRRNRAERAIRTWKNHFISILCSTDESFPLKLWDRLLEQTQITLNLLRGSRVNPKLSAYAQLFGPFDFNRTPLGPPGTRVLVHELPKNRGSWAPHAVLGYYTGPAFDHYRCFKTWILETGSERIADTLAWFPTQVPLPRTSSADAATAAAQDLIYALQNPHPASPLSPLNDEHLKSLRLLAEMFNTAAPLPKLPAASETSTAPSPPPRVKVAETPAVPRVADTEFTYVQGTRNRGQMRRQQAARRKALQNESTPQPKNTNRYASLAEPDEDSESDSSPITPPVTSHELEPKKPKKRRHQQRRQQPPPKVKQTRRPGAHRHATRSKIWYRQKQVANHTVVDSTVHRQHFINSVIDPDTGESLEYRHLIKGPDADKWKQANINEIGRLTDGRVGNGIVGTNTIKFIHPSALPPGRKPTYLRVVAAYRPQKEDPYRIRYTVGGDRINYPGETTTPGAEMTTVKLLLNSTISTSGARFMCTDVKDFYLNTAMDRYEYMWIPINLLDATVLAAYELQDLIVNGRVLVEIQKGMYGLPQAGRIAYDKLVNHLAPHGYHPCQRTPGLWRHVTRPVTFCLVVDDFGVKYVGKQHADHLLHALQTEYKITSDWEGKLYCGITLRWDYKAATVDLSMPGYIDRALHKFHHQAPYRPEHAPHAWNAPVYGKNPQLTAPEDESTPLDKKGILRVQSIIGTTLFYARAVDLTALPAIGSISAEQSKATENTNKKLARLLDYFATHPNATIRYHKSDMVLYIHSDASYLSEKLARSRMGGHFFLSSMPADPTRHPLASDTPPPNNGAIKTNSTIMKSVLSSAAEAEAGGMFLNCQDALPIRVTLSEMGHPQPATHVRGDNSTAIGIANNTIKQRRSKAMDMRFFWLQDREAQQHFKYYWDKGEGNLADYSTKHHSVNHHRTMRPVYLHPQSNEAHCMQGCADATGTRTY